MKLAALVVVPVLFLAGYVYWHNEPTFGDWCEAAARQRFSQIALDNSRSFQADLDMFSGQEGAGRAILENSGTFKKFVDHLAGSACSCAAKKASDSYSTPRELALQECIEEVRAKP